MIRPRTTKFGVVTHMGKGCFRQTAATLHLHKCVARFVSDSWFLLRDAMLKCGLCCGPVSITLVHCIQTAEVIVKLLCRPGSPIILVFWSQAPVPNSKGNPFSGGAKYKGGGKVLRFSTEIAVYLGNVTRYAHGCYETLIRRHKLSIEWWHKPYLTYRMVPYLVTLTDL